MKSKNHVRTVSGKPSATSGGILGYIGLIFWGSPDANTVPTPFPGYPAA